MTVASLILSQVCDGAMLAARELAAQRTKNNAVTLWEGHVDRGGAEVSPSHQNHRRCDHPPGLGGAEDSMFDGKMRHFQETTTVSL